MNTRRLNRIVTFITALILVLSLVTAACAATTLKSGSKGDKVRLLQDALKAEGIYKGDIDGVYGKSTEEAVRVYQSKVGLPADGIAGSKTQLALYEGKVEANDLNNTALKQSIQAKNPRSMTYGMSGDRVAELQRALRKTGDYHGPTDGKYGAMTLNAVIRFQQRHKLRPDGIAGVATIAKLNAQPGVKKVSTGFELTDTSTGVMVKTMQQCLNTILGVDISDAAGVFGSSTKAELIKWQKLYASTADGVLTEGQYNLMLKQRQQIWSGTFTPASTSTTVAVTALAAAESATTDEKTDASTSAEPTAPTTGETGSSTGTGSEADSGSKTDSGSETPAEGAPAAQSSGNVDSDSSTPDTVSE